MQKTNHLTTSKAAPLMRLLSMLQHVASLSLHIVSWWIVLSDTIMWINGAGMKEDFISSSIHVGLFIIVQMAKLFAAALNREKR
jgi:hypothetical protein